MNVIFLKQFSKDISKITTPTVKIEILKAIEQVEQAQTTAQIENLKKLKGFRNAYRLKIGDYRIGVFISKNIVEFARVVHRKDIYRLFP